MNPFRDRHSRRPDETIRSLSRDALPRGAGRTWALALPFALALAHSTVGVSYGQVPNAAPETATSPRTSAPATTTAAAPAVAHTGHTLIAPLPTDLRDVNAWVAYKTTHHIASLPTESRLFYRRGLIARQSGQVEDAFVLVRGASELDPTFLQPHLTLASWLLVREPSLALLRYATALELVRQSFNLQMELAANLLLLGLQALFAGLVASAVLVVFLRREELLHALREELGRRVSGISAKLWAWVILVAPFALGFGLAIPALFLLGLLWHSLRIRERTLFVLLALVTVIAPFASGILQRVALPLRADGPPYYGVPTLQNAAHSAETQARFVEIAAREPNNPFVQFGLAWTARRGGDLSTAERAYRRSLELWPSDDRLLNNLGNTLAMQGRGVEALEIYQKAVAANGLNAAAWFNQAQVYTQRFQYQQASDAMSRASALNFELVKALQSQASEDGLLPLADQWPEPRTFWRALAHVPAAVAGGAPMPLELRRHIETSGPLASGIALLAAIAGLVAGTWLHRRLPLRVCSGCGRIVCRRCAERRREAALCRQCTRLEARAENPEFSHVLLFQQRQARMRRIHLWRTAIASILPGYGLLAHRHVFVAVGLLAVTWTLARAWFGLTAPFAIEPRLALPGEEVPAAAILATFAIVHAISLAGYFRLVGKEKEREAQIQAVQRGRITQATRRSSLAA